MTLFRAHSIFALSFSLGITVHAQNDVVTTVEAQLSEVVWSQISGDDSRFDGWVAPGQLGLVRGQSPEQNVSNAVAQIAAEVARIYGAFAGAADGKRSQSTIAELAKVHSQTAKEKATRVFPTGAHPPASWIRQIAILPAASLGAQPAQRVFQELSAFEMLPKPEDTYFHYTNAFDLTSGAREIKGSRSSHLVNHPGMAEDEPTAMKKCRHIFLLGWFCNTSHYLASTVNLPADSGDDPARVMVTTLVDLTRKSDGRQFSSGGRNQNTAQGYTALTLVARAGDSVIVYFSGIQHTERTPSFPGFEDKLDQGHKIEANQLMERLSHQLGL